MWCYRAAFDSLLLFVVEAILQSRLIYTICLFRSWTDGKKGIVAVVVAMALELAIKCHLSDGAILFGNSLCVTRLTIQARGQSAEIE